MCSSGAAGTCASPNPFVPPDMATATQALMPLCPWAQGSGWELGLGSSRGHRHEAGGTAGQAVPSHGTPRCSGLWVLNASTGSKIHEMPPGSQSTVLILLPALASCFPCPRAGHRSSLQQGETLEKQLLLNCALPKPSPLHPRAPPVSQQPWSTQHTWLVPVAGGQRLGGGGMLPKELCLPAHPILLPPTPSAPTRLPNPLSTLWVLLVLHRHCWGAIGDWRWGA